MATAIYLGYLVAAPSVEAKINEKHHITLADVREALQWPAIAQVVEDDDPEHGWRLLAIGKNGLGREVFAALIPLPESAGTTADTWAVKTARWIY